MQHSKPFVYGRSANDAPFLQPAKGLGAAKTLSQPRAIELHCVWKAFSTTQNAGIAHSGIMRKMLLEN
jgi:hypothetical protein